MTLIRPLLRELTGVIIYLLGYFCKDPVGFFFLVEGAAQYVVHFFFAEHVGEFAKRSIGSDF